MVDSAAAIEARINQISQRIDNISAAGPSRAQGANRNNTANPQESFKAIASMMQAQMLSQGLSANSNNNNDSGLGGSNMMNMGMMMMLQQQAGMANGANMQAGLWSQLPNTAATSPVQAARNLSADNRLDRVDKAEFPVNNNQARVSSHFGHRHHPIDGKESFHKGIDIAAPLGAPIKAPWNGEVVFVGHADGFGAKTVIIAHPETQQADGKILYSIFGHNDDVFVNVGDRITKGDQFATVGQDGHSTGPHLHWETRLAQPGLTGKNIFKEELSYALDPLKFA